MDKRYLTLFIIMVTEIMGFSLILPFIPFFAQEFGASAFTIGLIFVTFSLLQFISAPIMGSLSDQYGRVPLLMLSQLSTMLSYIILANASSLWMIFLSRAVDGLLGSNFTIARAYIADITQKKDRSKVFGLTGAAFGFGFLIGPGVGGVLADINYSLPSYLAAGFSLLTIVLTWKYLPETVKKPKDKISVSIIDTSYLRHLLTSKISGLLVGVFGFMLNHALFVTQFALYASILLNYTPRNVGLLMTYVGGISVVLRLGTLQKLIDTLGERTTVYVGFASLLCAMALLIFIQASWMLFVMISLFAIGSSFVRPILSGSISNFADEDKQGAVNGVVSSLQSIGQIVAPLIGGLLLEVNPRLLGAAGFIIVTIAIGFTYSSRSFVAHKIPS